MNTIVDKVAFAMPWTGSLVPAVMTFTNAQRNLGFGLPEALVIGVVVEGLGFVSITTALDYYELNVAEDRKQNGQFWVALGGAIFYVLIVLLVNAILDDGTVLQKLGKGLLALMAVVGGVMVALRNQLGKRRAKITQAEIDQQQAGAESRAFEQRLEEEKLKLAHEAKLKRIEESSRLKIEKIKAEALRKVDGQSPEAPEKKAGSIRRWPEVPESDWEWIDQAPVGEIVRKYTILGKDPERQARTWKKYAREAIQKRGGEM